MILENLIEYWKQQGLPIAPGVTSNQIKKVEISMNLNLPVEFKNYLTFVNGMVKKYPYDEDKNGMSFYSLEDLILFENEFQKDSVNKLHPDLVGRKTIIFADYMHKSWSYGLRVEDEHYSIIVIYSYDRYRTVSDSFNKFLDLYINHFDMIL
jgi:hypothetical protein